MICFEEQISGTKFGYKSLEDSDVPVLDVIAVPFCKCFVSMFCVSVLSQCLHKFHVLLNKYLVSLHKCLVSMLFVSILC